MAGGSKHTIGFVYVRWAPQRWRPKLGRWDFGRHWVMEHAKNKSGGHATEAALAALARKVASMTWCKSTTHWQAAEINNLRARDFGIGAEVSDGRSLSVSVSSSMNPKWLFVSWTQTKKTHLLYSLPVWACDEVTLIQPVDKQVLVAKQAGRIELKWRAICRRRG